MQPFCAWAESDGERTAKPSCAHRQVVGEEGSLAATIGREEGARDMQQRSFCWALPWPRWLLEEASRRMQDAPGPWRECGGGEMMCAVGLKNSFATTNTLPSPAVRKYARRRPTLCLA